MVWSIDKELWYERLDYYKHSNPDDRNSQTIIKTYIYHVCCALCYLAQDVAPWILSAHLCSQ
jgi:hypothetical protein